MTVYVDTPIWYWKGRRWCHLFADDVAELHRFASRLGLHALSYQGPPKTSKPHYDITGFERDRAVRIGAVPCGREEVVRILRELRASPRQVRPLAPDTPVPSLPAVSPGLAVSGG